jgi:hypothetical protein
VGPVSIVIVNCVHCTYSDGLDPIFYPDVYDVDNGSSSSVKDVNFTMIASRDNGTVAVVEGNGTSNVLSRSVVESLNTATPCETSSMIRLSSLMFIAACPLDRL